MGILAVGGINVKPLGYPRKSILRLRCQEDQDVTECKWEKLPQELPEPRGSHVVMPLPASYEICNN